MQSLLKSCCSACVFLLLLGNSSVAAARVMTATAPKSRRAVIAEVRNAAAKRLQRRVPKTLDLTTLYRNVDLDVSLRYPATWEEQPVLQTENNVTLVVMFLSPTKKSSSVRENMNLVIEKLEDPSIALSEYTDEGLSKLKQAAQSFTLLRSERITAAGNPAQRVTYQGRFSGTSLKFSQVWFFHRGSAYVLTFADEEASFDTSVSTFDRMLETLVVE